MSDQITPEVNPYAAPDELRSNPIESPESTSKRDHERLRSTIGHYINNPLALTIGLTEMALTGFPLPKEIEDLKEKAFQSIDETSATFGVLSSIEPYQYQPKRLGDIIVYNIDAAIQARLHPNKEQENASQEDSPAVPIEEVPDMFTLYKNTFGKHAGNRLTTTDTYLRMIAQSISDPQQKDMLTQAMQGLKKTAIIEEVINRLTPDHEPHPDQGGGEYYNLDTQIQEASKIQQFRQSSSSKAS